MGWGQNVLTLKVFMTALTGVISYPIPAYQNLPINANFYVPNRFVISAVSLGFTTIITTTQDLNYVIGQEVKMIIPPSYGCRQLNEKKGFVISIPSSNQVEVSINSLENVDAFINANSLIELAQILSVGDINTGILNANGRSSTGTFIPGSFINISPQ